MKHWILAFCIASTPLLAKESIDLLSKETDALYREGIGGKDGAYTPLGFSMLGWSIVLAVGIGLLAGYMHQSTASSTSQ